MSTFKLDSQPYQPSIKSRHIQKKMATMKTVYSSNYLKLLKDYNTQLPENCSIELLEFITKTQQQFQSSHSHSNETHSKYSTKFIPKDQKQSEPKSHAYRAQFTSKKRSEKIETLIPTSKPIPIHHPSLRHSSTILTSSSSSSSTNSFDSDKSDINETESNEMNQNEIIGNNNEMNINNNEIIINEKRKQSREKQIYFGKSTKEYQNYLSIIPKEKRLLSDPKTPDIESQLSKRSWDKNVRKWRRSLHAFDTVTHENQIELARALAFRLQNEHDPKKKMSYYSSYSSSSSQLCEE